MVLVEGRVSMETVFFKFPHWGTERVGGDEGNEKEKKREKLFSFLLSQNCCRNLRRNGHKLLIISMRIHVNFN